MTGLERLKNILDQMYKKANELQGEVTPIKDLLLILKDTTRDLIAEEAAQKPTADKGLVEELYLPWHIAATSEDQVMFLNSHEKYCGAVQIKQHPISGFIGEMDEQRRRLCAEYILKAVNNYSSQESLDSVGCCPKCGTLIRDMSHESLAELAEKKGYGIRIEILCKPKMSWSKNPEVEARAWLNEQEDICEK